MKRHIPLAGTLLAGLLLANGASATELVYTPVNPSFGGSPLNGAWLLGNAQAQDDHKDPDAIDRSALSGSALDRFTSQLESRLLSQMLSNIEQGKEGVLTTDDFIIHIVNDDLGNLTVNITDKLTGEISEIIVDGYSDDAAPSGVLGPRADAGRRPGTNPHTTHLDLSGSARPATPERAAGCRGLRFP